MLLSFFLPAAVVGLLVVAVSLAAPGAASAQEDRTNTVGFEDYPANRVGTPAAAGITDFYRRSGLLFARPVTALVYNEESVPADPDFPRSGSTVITTCYAAEFCSNNIEMQLLSTQERVRLWVGYDGRLRAAATLLLIGFDGQRNPVARNAVSMGPSEVRLPVDIPIEISDPEGRISFVQLVWADDSQFLSGLSVDDIELTPFVATASVEFETDLVPLDADDGPVTQQVRLINTGPVEVEVATVEIELADPNPDTDRAARFETDSSACITVLERGSSCEVTVSFSAEENGTVPARLMARNSAGEVLAVTTVEGSFSGAVVDTTETTTGTTGDPTTETTTGTTGGTRTGSNGQSGLDDGENPTDQVAALIAVLPVAVVIILALALTIGIRRLGRFRKRPPRPEPHPKPELSVRPGDGVEAVVGDDGPLVAIRAVIGTGETELIESRTS